MRVARLLLAVALALLVGYALGEAWSGVGGVWTIFVCLLIAIVTGLPAVTGGWTMLAGLSTAPFFAWSVIAVHDHPPWVHESNDTFAGFILWLANSFIVVVGALSIAVIRTFREGKPLN